MAPQSRNMVPQSGLPCPPLSAESVPSSGISATAPWRPASPAPSPRAASTNLFLYDPALSTAEEIHAFRRTIHANQFPADPARCNRTLILFDDAKTAGLGYTARLLGRALLVAVNEDRVLMNAPHPTARWCGRWPHTLACLYEPWTHCPLPANFSALSKWSHRSAYGRSADDKERRQQAPSVRISTAQIHAEKFFYKFHQARQGEASLYELLFRPRAWVREAARCAIRSHGLSYASLVVMHVRHSAEKAVERGSRRWRLSPPTHACACVCARVYASSHMRACYGHGRSHGSTMPAYPSAYTYIPNTYLLTCLLTYIHTYL